MPRRRILCFASYFLPGFRAGGPIRSLQRAIHALQGDFDFGVVTRDHDLGSTERYSGATGSGWTEADGIPVTYLHAPCRTPLALRQVIRSFRPDLLYFHSFWDPCIVALPLLLRRIGAVNARLPVLVAPRGEFAPSALALKGPWKSAWLRLVRTLGLYRAVTWHASNDQEAGQVRALWGASARVLVASDLPPRVAPGFVPSRRPKVAGELRVVFLSRISPMKNLEGALRMLAQVRTPMRLDVYGTRESEEYWQACEHALALLPPHVTVSCHGPVEPDGVIGTMAAHDLFFLPTLGENFGHVILEAMLAGCPVLISDRTPWKRLEEHYAGYALSLDDPTAFAAALDGFAAMDDAAFRRWSEGAARLGRTYCEDDTMRSQARAVIEQAMTQDNSAR